jgi:hypothetical protein
LAADFTRKRGEKGFLEFFAFFFAGIGEFRLLFCWYRGISPSFLLVSGNFAFLFAGIGEIRLLFCWYRDNARSFYSFPAFEKNRSHARFARQQAPRNERTQAHKQARTHAPIRARSCVRER